MATQGGPARQVSVQNGGGQQGGPAIPITVVSDGRAAQGGPALPIYLVTSGPMQSGPALPVVAAPYAAQTVGGSAIPAYIVGGGYLPSSYDAKVLALAPIAYWPLDEASGAVITDRSGNGRNGSYSNVALGVTGIGDGRTAARFNGSTSFGNVYSASLASAFNNQELTVCGWFKASGAGVWTDSTIRRLIYLAVDANNRVIITRPAANNEIDWNYIAGGTNKAAGKTSFSPTAWFHVAVTVSKAADQLIGYVGGVAVGSPATGLGVWAGSLATTTTLIGAVSTAPANVWSGDSARVALFDRALSAAQIASLAVVS